MNTEAPTSFSLDIKGVLEALPHRYPFLLVDKILLLDLEKKIVRGQKNVTINEDFFNGHFPDHPIMPGVLVLEALAQTGAVFIYYRDTDRRTTLLLNIKNAKFRQPVKPGDTLIMECSELHFSQKGGRFHAQATVDGKLVVEAEFGYALVPKEQI